MQTNMFVQPVDRIIMSCASPFVTKGKPCTCPDKKRDTEAILKFTMLSRYPTSCFVYEHKLRPALLLLCINQVTPRMGCFFT